MPFLHLIISCHACGRSGFRLERLLRGIAQREEDGHNGGCFEQRHEALGKRDGTRLHLNRLFLVDYGQQLAVEIGTQMFRLALHLLVGEERFGTGATPQERLSD